MLQERRNETFSKYLSNLSADKTTDYSLWEATYKLKRPKQSVPPIRKNDGNWARCDKEKAETFMQHLATAYTPLLRDITQDEEQNILEYLESPLQLSPKIYSVTISEIKNLSDCTSLAPILIDIYKRHSLYKSTEIVFRLV